MERERPDTLGHQAALQQLNSVLEAVLAESVLGRIRSIRNVCSLLAIFAALVLWMNLLRPLLYCLIYFESLPGFLILATLGTFTVLFLVRHVYAKALLRRIARDDQRFPLIYKLSHVSGRPALDRQHIQRQLSFSGAGEQLITEARKGSGRKQLRSMLFQLGSTLSLGRRPGLASSVLGLIITRCMPQAILLILALLAMSFWLMGPERILIPVSLVVLIAAIASAQADRHYFLMPEVGRYLAPLLDFYARFDNLQAARQAETVMPPQVQLQPGSGELGLLAVQLGVILQRRGSLFGRYLSPGYLVPIALTLFLVFAIAAGLAIYQGYIYSLISFLIFGSYLCMVLWVRLKIDSLAGQHFAQATELCRSSGLLQKLAMGLLPLDELHASVLGMFHPLLYRPTRPAELAGGSAGACWTLMWNMDFYIGRKVPSLRERWHAYWLLPLLSPVLPAGFIMFFYALSWLIMSWPGGNERLTVFFLAGLLLSVISHLACFRMLLVAARHMAGAWGVVQCMEELVQEGEDEG